MTCFHTSYAWRADKPNANGKRPLDFSSKKSILDESCLEVPCGRCVGCQSDKARIWSIRMFHEMQMHDRNSFVTLTYANSGQSVVDKKHLQDFFKRLRKQYKFRYFACAEYGDMTLRPHYHIVFFGEDFRGGSYPISDDLYGNKIIEMIWKYGMVAIGSVTMESIKYVAGYVQKKIGKQFDDTFALMSRKPGLGKGWLDKYKCELIANGFVVIDGVKLDIPPQYMKYYEHEFEEVKEKRKENVRKYTSQELAAKKANLKAKLGLKVEIL